MIVRQSCAGEAGTLSGRKEVRPSHLHTGGKGAVEGGTSLKEKAQHAENATEARGEEEVRKPRSECCGYVRENEDLGFSPGEGGREHVTGGV